MTIEIFLIERIYQRFFSPVVGGSCRFQPTCSSYGISALQRYGFLTGNLKIIWRILRCSPLSKGGYDPA